MLNIRCKSKWTLFTDGICSPNRWKTELDILWRHKVYIFIVACVQYLHSAATNIAYYRHDQLMTLRDIGFEYIPPISPQLRYLSEVLFFFVIFSTTALGFLPFCYKRPRICMLVMYVRCIIVMGLCASIRTITFLSTSLPGPAPHCQPNSIEYSPPETIYDILFDHELFKGCGDLIFSNHMSLSFTFVLTIHVYSSKFLPKKLCQIISYCVYFPIIIIQAILIIAARKHYTVDVVVALYTTPLLYYASYYFVDDFDVNDYNKIGMNDKIDEENSKLNKETEYLLFPIH